MTKVCIAIISWSALWVFEAGEQSPNPRENVKRVTFFKTVVEKKTEKWELSMTVRPFRRLTMLRPETRVSGHLIELAKLDISKGPLAKREATGQVIWRQFFPRTGSDPTNAEDRWFNADVCATGSRGEFWLALARGPEFGVYKLSLQNKPQEILERITPDEFKDPTSTPGTKQDPAALTEKLKAAGVLATGAPDANLRAEVRKQLGQASLDSIKLGLDRKNLYVTLAKDAHKIKLAYKIQSNRWAILR